MRELSKRLRNWNNADEGVKKYEIVIGVIILLVAAFFFCFMKDFKLTMQQSLLFDTTLIHGKVHKFYSIVNSQALKGAFPDPWPASLLSGANYPIINYATLGLICFPLYAIDKFFKLSLSIYAYEAIIKILYVAMTIYMSKLVYDICGLIGCEKTRKGWVAFSFLTSPVLLFSAVVITHLDIFSIFFLLLGIRSLLKKNHRNELIFFALAAAYKPYVLIGIIPIVLLKEKRIMYLLRDFIVVLVGIILQNGIYHFDPGYARVQNFMSKTYGFIDRFFSTGFYYEKNCYHDEASLFVISFIVVCVAAYMLKKVKPIHLFAFPLVTWCAFVLFVGWHPNWIINIVPFMILVLACTHEVKLYCILETIFAFAFYAVTFIGWEANYDNGMIGGGIFSKLMGLEVNENYRLFTILREKLDSIPTAIYGSVLCGITASYIGLVVYDCYRERKGKLVCQNKIEWDRGAIWVRVLPFVLFVVYSFVSCLI